jgi:hypothetical protein
MHADQSVVMRDSATIEEGTRETLLEADGYYAQSWRQQVERGWGANGQAALGQLPEQPLFNRGRPQKP